MARKVTDPREVRFKAPVRIALGVCGFLMVHGNLLLWWIGFLCAVIALFSSVRLLKSGAKKERVASVIAVVLAVAAGVAYFIKELSAGINLLI
ncbi:MAG TPA: hypothetical protein DEB31_04970 [Clostridiales bacterium]|nr:hypothetical protein [Clostridiales bacterium]